MIDIGELRNTHDIVCTSLEVLDALKSPEALYKFDALFKKKVGIAESADVNTHVSDSVIIFRIIVLQTPCGPKIRRLHTQQRRTSDTESTVGTWVARHTQNPLKSKR